MVKNMGRKVTEKHDNESMFNISSFEELGNFLKEKGWFPEKLENNNTYKIEYYGDNWKFICLAQLREDLEQFVFYVVPLISIPKNKRQDVAEYITRANYGLRIGNLEMDFSDGEVRYKSSIDFEREYLSPNMIDNAIHPAIHSMERYMYGLISIIHEDVFPREAIASVEYEGSFSGNSPQIGHA